MTERRDRAWLARFIQDPSALIEAKDPVATAMLRQYRDLTMPKLGLSDHDVEQLIGYLEAQGGRINSAGIDTNRQAPANAAAHAH